MIIPSVAQIVGDRPLPITDPEQSVRDACRELDRYDVGAMVVMEGDSLIGILSERDVIRKCICAGRKTSDTRVCEIMTASPQTLKQNSRNPVNLKPR